MLTEYFDEEEHEMTPLYDFNSAMENGFLETEDVIEENNSGNPDEVITEDVVDTPAFEYPEYIGEEWIPPADADNEWYRDKYQSIHGLLGSEELGQKLLDANRDRLLEQEKGIERFRELYIAHQEGNTDFLRQNFPDELAKIGISPVLKEDEIDGLIEVQLKEEFGDDYADVFDQKQIIKPTSISAKIFNRSQELVRQYSTENERRQQLVQNYQPAVAQAPLDYDAEYERDFKEVPREQYDSLIDTLKKDYPSWTLKKLLRVVTYEDDLAKAREEGRQEGVQKATKDLRAIGNSKTIARERQKEDDDDDDRPSVYGSDWAAMMNKMIYN